MKPLEILQRIALVVVLTVRNAAAWIASRKTTKR